MSAAFIWEKFNVMEQHRYAVERAARLRKHVAHDEIERNQGVSLQGEANGSDAEMLDEVADFLRSLEGSKKNQAITDPGGAFVADWNQVIGTISNFCGMYDLPKPDMLFHPKWQARMSMIAQQQIGSPLIYAGVRVRFGTYRSMDVLVPQ